MSAKKIVTIPNILSVFRIILAIIFLNISVKWGLDKKREILLIILILSGLTDFMDGKIARKFNMISELGKILDPIADKLTQGVLWISFLHKYKMAKFVLVLFMIKETYMGVMGLKTVSMTRKNEGAMWYGKVSTAFFYITMILLFLVPQIPDYLAEGMMSICGFFMLMALILYDKHYRKLQNDVNVEKKQAG